MNLFNITCDSFGINFTLSWILILFVILLYSLIKFGLLDKILAKISKNRNFEISELKLGIGENTITLKPNQSDREIAYKLWVELSTRKLGLPMDLNEDVIVELYNSWYAFFGVARELLKEFPISKLNNGNEKDLVEITTELLNDVLRVHLTKWQAKFRKWYKEELENPENIKLTPQEIQRKYDKYNELTEDMLKINDNLKYYQDILYSIAYDKDLKE
ncbi:hypothetical protein [Methanobrevibacter sp.]|uniref:hypothetical protein n=1 Tax=Methanobrevibacter sp. TaxID=66852 RepID=UPI003869DA69